MVGGKLGVGREHPCEELLFRAEETARTELCSIVSADHLRNEPDHAPLQGRTDFPSLQHGVESLQMKEAHQVPCGLVEFL